MIYIQAILIFIFSISNDLFSVKWHEYREKKEPLKGGIISVVLGVIAWFALIWVVDESRWLMVPDLIGTFVGSYYGIKYHHAPLPIAIALGFYKSPEKE